MSNALSVQDKQKLILVSILTGIIAIPAAYFAAQNTNYDGIASYLFFFTILFIYPFPIVAFFVDRVWNFLEFIYPKQTELFIPDISFIRKSGLNPQNDDDWEKIMSSLSKQLKEVGSEMHQGLGSNTPARCEACGQFKDYRISQDKKSA